MAKFEKISSDIQAQFDDILKNRTSLSNMVQFELIAKNDLKQVYKTMKASDLYKWKTGKEVIIIVNEIVFEQLDESSQKLLLEEALMYVTFDSEKDKIIIEAPDLITFAPIIKKYPQEFIRTFECVKAIFEAEKQRKEEEKEAAKISKKPKK